MNRQVGSQPTIEAELEALQYQIHAYRRTLNDEAVWLFLATLGCWGVTSLAMQFVALAVVVMLFGRRVSQRISETRSASALVDAVERKISMEIPEGDARKARLYDLAELRKVELSKMTVLKQGRTFLVCWVFYALTFGHALHELGQL